jgi:hypothetical protein
MLPLSLSLSNFKDSFNEAFFPEEHGYGQTTANIYGGLLLITVQLSDSLGLYYYILESTRAILHKQTIFPVIHDNWWLISGLLSRTYVRTHGGYRIVCTYRAALSKGV